MAKIFFNDIHLDVIFLRELREHRTYNCKPGYNKITDTNYVRDREKERDRLVFHFLYYRTICIHVTFHVNFLSRSASPNLPA